MLPISTTVVMLRTNPELEQTAVVTRMVATITNPPMGYDVSLVGPVGFGVVGPSKIFRRMSAGLRGQIVA